MHLTTLFFIFLAVLALGVVIVFTNLVRAPKSVAFIFGWVVAVIGELGVLITGIALLVSKFTH